MDVLKREIFPAFAGDRIPISLTSSPWRHHYIALAVPKQTSYMAYFLILHRLVAVAVTGQMYSASVWTNTKMFN
jgi:hypothetical protein